MRRDYGNEILVAIGAISVLVFALAFAVIILVAQPSGATATPSATSMAPSMMDTPVTPSTPTPPLPRQGEGSPTAAAVAADATLSNEAIVLTVTAIEGATRAAQFTPTLIPSPPTPPLPRQGEGSPAPTNEPSPTVTRVVAAAPTDTDEPASPTPTRVPPTATPRPTDTPVPSETPRPAATVTRVPATDTATRVPSTETVAPTDTARPSVTPSRVPPSATPLPTTTPTRIPPTNTPSPVPTATPLPPTATATPTATHTATFTPTPTATFTATLTLPPTLTYTPSPTPTATLTPPPTTAAQAAINATLTACPPPFGWVEYRVRLGDTLFSIAGRVGSTVGELRVANCLPNANNIFGEQLIYVPPTGGGAATMLVEGCESPNARITAPTIGQIVSGVFEVTGTATVEDFRFYRLEIRPVESAVYNEIARGGRAVQGGRLGLISSRRFAPGVYVLRLVVVDQRGSFPQPCAIPIVVGG